MPSSRIVSAAILLITDYWRCRHEQDQVGIARRCTDQPSVSQVCTGRKRYFDLSVRDIRVPKDAPQEVVDLIEACRFQDPSIRPEITEVADRLENICPWDLYISVSIDWHWTLTALMADYNSELTSSKLSQTMTTGIVERYGLAQNAATRLCLHSGKLRQPLLNQRYMVKKSLLHPDSHIWLSHKLCLSTCIPREYWAVPNTAFPTLNLKLKLITVIIFQWQ